MLTKLKLAHKRALKNKRGVTFIELIAVVAIMGVLSVTIGSLLTSATSAYIRQKESASAKDVSQIVSKEIARKLTSCNSVFLQNGDLPGSTYSDTDYDYTMDNYPFASKPQPSSFYSSDGILVYSESGGPAVSYFTTTDAEKTAFYGSYDIELRYTAIQNVDGDYIAVRIYVDVYSDGKIKYESTDGKTVTFLEVTNPSFTGSIVHSFAEGYYGTVSEPNITINTRGSDKITGSYKELINNTTEYTHLYFV